MRPGRPRLYDEPRSGRPRTLTDRVRDTLVDMSEQDPEQSDYPATLWTVAMLALALAEKIGVYRAIAPCVRRCMRPASPGAAHDSPCPARLIRRRRPSRLGNNCRP